MNNKQIAAILHQIADYLELSGENAFRVGAYRKAARAVENSRFSVSEEPERIPELPGVGKGTASIIQEILDTGTAGLLEELKEQLPPELPQLLLLPGLGPKSIYTLYKELGITNLEQLKESAENGEIRRLPGFGVRKEQKILEAIKQFNEQPERVLLSQAILVAERLLERLRVIPQISKAEVAGSVRRRKETIKDLDFVIATEEPEEVAERIAQIPEVIEVEAKGDTKVRVRVEVEDIIIGADFRMVSPEQFATALHHFTGSKEHNVRIRQRAKQFGWKVNEYGIVDAKTGETRTFPSEEAFFHHLDLPYIPPELREDRGEIERAEARELPRLIEKSDYRGDLHCHTLYSDGADSIYKMAHAAEKRGYEYLAITDHSQSLRVAGGLSVEDVRQQWEEIDRLNEELENITILKGTEMDILPDGRLDFPDELLAEMDLVIASVHSSFRQSEEMMTRRLVEAMENPYVHIIAHPTGRLLLRREGYKLNLEHILQTAKDTGTILEINANPNRLDLSDELVKKAKEEYGILFTINTDAHSVNGFDLVDYGIATARRGWLEAKDVINTYSLAELKQILQRKRKKFIKE